jgi:hypothetical protein
MKVKQLKRTSNAGKRRSPASADVYEANTAPRDAQEPGIELGRRDRKWESGKQTGHKI